MRHTHISQYIALCRIIVYDMHITVYHSRSCYLTVYHITPHYSISYHGTSLEGPEPRDIKATRAETGGGARELELELELELEPESWS